MVANNGTEYEITFDVRNELFRNSSRWERYISAVEEVYDVKEVTLYDGTEYGTPSDVRREVCGTANRVENYIHSLELEYYTLLESVCGFLDGKTDKESLARTYEYLIEFSDVLKEVKKGDEK